MSAYRTARIWRSKSAAGCCVLLTVGATIASPAQAESTEQAPSRITILYDAFGKSPLTRKDWGYAALIEHGGRRILFDTGNSGDILEHNAKATGVDLSRLDAVVMSHRHGDHVGGLAHVLKVNPTVKIYAPSEGFGVFGAALPSTFYRKDGSLPPEQRYFDGRPPETMRFGAAWPNANFDLVEHTREIAPGIHLISLVSSSPGTLELRELSLALDTPEGVVIIVGCSHPGVEAILEAAKHINPRIRLLAGGFHLAASSDAQIKKIAAALHDDFKPAFIAPGHCSGEPTSTALQKMFGKRYLYAGVGASLPLPK